MAVVKFRCKQSGNTVAFSNETDIESMRREPHYEEITADVVANVPAVDETLYAPMDQVTKRGRPRKLMEI